MSAGSALRVRGVASPKSDCSPALPPSDAEARQLADRKKLMTLIALGGYGLPVTTPLRVWQCFTAPLMHLRLGCCAWRSALWQPAHQPPMFAPVGLLRLLDLAQHDLEIIPQLAADARFDLAQA